MKQLYEYYRSISPSIHLISPANATDHWLCEVYYFCEFANAVFIRQNTFISLCQIRQFGPILQTLWDQKDPEYFELYTRRYYQTLGPKIQAITDYHMSKSRLRDDISTVNQVWCRCQGIGLIWQGLRLFQAILSRVKSHLSFYRSYAILMTQGVRSDLIDCDQSARSVDLEAVAQCVTARYKQTINDHLTQSSLLTSIRMV